MSVLVEPKRAPLSVSRPDRGHLLDLACVGLPALVGLLLCLYDLSTRNLWLDEAASITIASQHGAALGAAMAHDGGNMLGFYALLHVLIGAFGHGSLVARLPSALAGGATIALTSALGLRLFNRRVALIAGLLGAVSLPLVYWAQDARGYMLMIAFLCASFLLLVVALQRDRPSWGLWLGYVAVTTAAVYMGLEAVLAIPAQLALLIWHRRHARWFLSALLVAGLCCIPLAVLAVGRGSSQIFWIPLPNAFTTKQVLLTLSSAGLEPQFYTSTSEVLRWLTEVLVGLAALGVLWRLVRPGTRRGAWKLALIAGWLFGPPILAWVISELGHSMFEARYLLMSLPAVALLLAWLVVGLADARPAPTTPAGSRTSVIGLRVLAVGLLGTLFVLRALQLAPSYGVSTEPWRAVTRHVLASSRPGDCIAFYPLDSRMPFRYYLPAGAQPPRPILPSLSWGRTVPLVEAYATLSPAQLGRVSSRCGRVWLVSGHEGHNSGTALARLHYQRFQSLIVGLQLHYLRTRVRTFGAAHIITLELLSKPLPPATGNAAF